MDMYTGVFMYFTDCARFARCRQCEEIGRMGRCWIIGFLDFPREGEVLRR